MIEINEKKLKEILAEQREEFRRRTDEQIEKQRKEFLHFFGIMKEGTNSKIQLLGEQFNEIKATPASHSKILASHGEMLAAHGEMLAQHREMIGAIMEDVQIIKNDVQFLKGAMKKKVDYEEFEALVKRVSILESKIRK